MTSRAVAVAVALGCAAGATAARADVGFDVDRVYRVSPGDSPTTGPADAPITIVAFSDFYCPHCTRLAGTLAELGRMYPGRLRVVYRHNLLDPDDGSLAAQVAMAAHRQGKFWPMHDLLYSTEDSLTRAVVEEYAELLGLDMARFRSDLDRQVDLSRIRADIAEADRLGIRATPMLFINGRPLTGAQPLGVLVQRVEEELERTDAMIRGGAEPAALYDAIVSRGQPRAGTIESGADASIPPVIDPTAAYAVGLGLPSHQRGADDALVTIVEFSDFECGYCRRSRATLEALRAELGDDLRLVWRHKPLTATGGSKLLAEAAIAAGEQGKFWEFHDRALAHPGPVRRADMEAFAREIGLDLARFRTALDDRTHLPDVLVDVAEGAALGVRGTPTFYINGTPVIGAVPLDEMRAVVQAKRTEAQALVAAGVPREDVYDEAIRRTIAARSASPATATTATPSDPIDAYIEVLVACRAKDGRAATTAFGRVTDRTRRGALRKECRRLGVKLP